ncbi:MAG: succinyldiaminopimelate transaminase [Actinomycetes bacterium]
MTLRSLPDFPWDTIAAEAALAAGHPDGLVDLSVGAPVDATPPVVQQALAAASNAPAYPATAGTAELRVAFAQMMERRHGVVDIDESAVLPTVGSKELVALLPFLLGIGQGDVVVVPELAYPTYAVGAQFVGADVVVSDALTAAGPARVRLVWVNSPANPHGRVLPVDHLAKVVAWARERGAVVASDECYLDFGWDAQPVSVLHPGVCGGDTTGILALHSLSKRSNLAGYRAGFVTGERALVRELLELRKHAGLIVPAPIQTAMVAALDDDAHVEEQKERYAARRATLIGAFTAAGFRVDHSDGGIYLWVTRDEPGRETHRWLAQRGILTAPGDFYGAAGGRHVRVALTATDDRVKAAVIRLGA